MYRTSLTKPDGRPLELYSRRPIREGLRASAPPGGRPAANPHLRWHPLRGEWIAYAGHRQGRTFLPPPEWNPLLPTDDPENPTELPAGDYDVAVFENLFPTLTGDSHDPPQSIVATRPALGRCEVVVFTQDPRASLGGLPLDHLALILEVWGERTARLAASADIAYVMPFENRGVEVGVTLHHPHGQIYAYPVVPPIAARELAMQATHLRERGTGLLAAHIAAELEDARRLLHLGPHATAFLPACARYAYEVWIAPLRPVARLDELTAAERDDLARALKTVLLKYDGLWRRPMPYVMVVHQAPTDGKPHPEAHVHLELYPALRMPDRLKYLAGSELGAGFFTADTFPEDKARELQAVKVALG